MDKAAIFLHGFNVKDNGAKSTDLVIPYFQKAGYDCHQMDYGWLFMLGASFSNKKLVSKLQDKIRELRKQNKRVTVVGHSNGACIGWLATQTPDYKDSPHALLCINPAIEPDEPLGKFVKKVVVLHSPEDGVMKYTNNFFVKIFAPSKWGPMGRDGYQGIRDSRIANIDIDDLVEGQHDIGHSTVFKEEFRDQVFPRVIKEYL